MFEKILSELRSLVGGMLISFMILMLCVEQDMGGAEVPGIICFILWLILLAVMRNWSTWGAVLASVVIYFLVVIVKFGITEEVLIEIGSIIVIVGVCYYKKHH